jgi:hypothetical protein
MGGAGAAREPDSSEVFERKFCASREGLLLAASARCNDRNAEPLEREVATNC